MLLTSSEAMLDWNGNTGVSTCVATSFSSVIKKKKKIIIKSATEFSFAWSSETWNSGKAMSLRVLSLFWESPYGTWQAHTFWHLLKQQYLWSHDNAWRTEKVLESNSLKINITNIPIYQVTFDIHRQEKCLVSQYWVRTSTEIYL